MISELDKLTRLIEDEKYGTMENLIACSIAKYRNREKRNNGRVDGRRNVTIEAVAEEIGIPAETLSDWLAEDVTNRLLRRHYVSYQKVREIRARSSYIKIMIDTDPNYQEKTYLPSYETVIDTGDFYGYEVVKGSPVNTKYDLLIKVPVFFLGDGERDLKWGKDYNTLVFSSSGEPIWTGLCMRKLGKHDHIEANLDKYYDLPLTHEESELVELRTGFRAYLDRESVLDEKEKTRREEKLDDK